MISLRAISWLIMFNDDLDLLIKVTTGDESWVFGYDIETKAQSSQWKRLEEPRPEKARQVRSNLKILFSVIFVCNGVVHHEFLSHRLREAIHQKRTELRKSQLWILHHDNAPAHTSILVHEFLAKNKTVIILQPSYLPDWTPAEVFLFPKLKTQMKVRRFATIEDIKEKFKQELLALKKSVIQKRFWDWKNTAISVLCLRGVTLKGIRSINTFWKN